MRRVIQPEMLDELPADDPRAIQSRRDLQKVNTFMGHPAMVARALDAASTPPRLVVELGAGDGTFLLRVAKRLRHRPRVRALLVDRRPSLSAATRSGFAAAGWDVDACESDVFEWLCAPFTGNGRCDRRQSVSPSLQRGRPGPLVDPCITADNPLHRVRAAALAHRANWGVPAAPHRLQRRDHA